MPKGYLSLVLHAHLPFVRHPEYDHFLEENWLFEAISETYLPLLRLFSRLDEDRVPFRVTMSISPTLAAMLQDELLQNRYVRHLEMMLELAGKEEQRISGDPLFRPLARMYHELYRANFQDFTETWQRDLLRGFDYFCKKGRIELITSAATHSFLPLYQCYPETVSAQIQTALDVHTKRFGKAPRGFWVPEFGYFPGLEEVLADNGIQYFFSAAHGILFADEKPQRGVYAPIQCPNGVAVFGRDLASANAVWSSEEGYPGDFSYRDFYRDIGFDLPLDYIAPYVHQGKTRVNTGFKYYAITGKTEQKIPYVPEAALRKAEEHAENFIYNRLKQADRLSPLMDRPPLIVSPYDAELFGHWWFEGPHWIETLIRSLARNPEDLEMVTPSDYLKLYPENQVTRPSFSSWGNKGYAEVWLDGSNDWIYRHTHKAIERMQELTRRFPDERGLKERALNQAAREVLLSQSSDWPFIIKTGTTVPYAVRRVKEHIRNFTVIYDALCRNTVNTEWLTRLERKHNLFPDLNYRIFKKMTE